MEKGKNEEVCQAVKAYFKYEGIPLAAVAERLGSTPRAVSAQLAGRPFSRKTAERYAELFGFNEVYLMTGEGQLVGSGTQRRMAREGTVLGPVYERTRVFDPHAH